MNRSYQEIFERLFHAPTSALASCYLRVLGHHVVVDHGIIARDWKKLINTPERGVLGPGVQ